MSQSKIHVIHENAAWSAPLFHELESLGLPYEDWMLVEGGLDLDAVPPEGVFYNRMSASSHTRGHRYSPEYAGAVLAWLEGHGRRVVNDSRALRLEISKVAQYASLRAFGIPTPRTVAAVGTEALLEAARSFPSPFITKHNRAGKGLGVRLFREVAALEAYAASPDFESPIDGITLLQEYIEAPEPCITRCELVGGQLLYAVRVDTSDGFELCPADACEVGEGMCPALEVSEAETTGARHRFEILRDFDHPLLERLPAFMAANGIEVAGIELIFDRGGRAFVYDVNTNTNYNSDAERRAGVPGHGMRAIARYLGSELARTRFSARERFYESDLRVSSPA